MQVIWQNGMTIDDVEEATIKAAMRFFNNNKTQTARSLGIAIRTLDSKISKYDASNVPEEDPSLPAGKKLGK